jgi:hypothetical protein
MSSLGYWDKIHIRAWSWLRGGLPQGHVQFDMKCDFVQYGNKVETIVKIYKQNLLGENILEDVKK